MVITNTTTYNKMVQITTEKDLWYRLLFFPIEKILNFLEMFLEIKLQPLFLFSSK